MRPNQQDMFCRDLELGRELRDEAVERVVENAGDWSTQAAEAARQYIQRLPSYVRFTGEDVRLDGLANLPRPHHHNAYGGVIGAMLRDALKRGLIRRDGFQQAKDPKAHARQYPAYVRTFQ